MLSPRAQAIILCVIGSLLGRDVAFGRSLITDIATKRYEVHQLKNVKSLPVHDVPNMALVVEPRYGKRIASSLKSVPVTLSWRGGAFPDLPAYFSASKTRCWFVLMLAILIDSGSCALMKQASDEASRSKLAISYLAYFVSLYGFSLSLKNLDVSIAYAVWAALGTAIVSCFGIILFKESYDLVKLGSLLMIVLGVVGLNLREQH